MNDEVSQPEPLLHSRTASAASLGVAATWARGAGQKGRHAIEDGLEERLAELTEWAITSRALGRQYLRTARRFVTAARQARHSPDDSHYQAHICEARQAHEQARKCLSFARLCQQRAECLAIIGNYHSSDAD